MSAAVTITLPEAVAQRVAAGRTVIREKHHYNLKPRHKAVLDALVMESLSQGEASVVIPSSQTLHELCGVPVQHVPSVVAELVAYRIVKATPTEEGMMRYVVNPDSESWRASPIVGRDAGAAARSLVATLNRRNVDRLPGGACGGEVPTAFLAKEAA